MRVDISPELRHTSIMEELKSKLENHRTRVAISRRNKTKARLVESAVLVFAEKGLGASVIEDVIERADVSRGTFYNYFSSNNELLAEAARQLENEIIDIIEANVVELTDPAERIATGTRLFIETARQYPILAQFMTSVGFPTIGPGNIINDYVPVHLNLGIQNGQFSSIAKETGLDIIRGGVAAGLHRMKNYTITDDYADRLVTSILMGLGMKQNVAQQLTSLPLPKLQISNVSLLKRSHLRASSFQ